MPCVRFSRVAFSYGPIDIFRDLSLQLEVGWTGVVGPNGSGKTTLLGLIAGVLSASGGHIDRGDMLIHTCAQRVDQRDESIDDFGGSWERAAIRARAALQLEPEQLDRWSSLSPGERKRWQIGAALHRRPDVLLLDEPTNHLDSSARQLLVSALHRYRGIGVVVSHDRTLLDEITLRTALTRNGEVTLYPRPYSAARASWAASNRAVRESHQAARSKERAVRRRLADARRDRSSAQRKLSTNARIKGPKDSDARSTAAKGRAANGEARLSRGVQLLRRAAERASAEVSEIRVSKERGRSLFVDFEAAPMSTVISLQTAEVCADSKGECAVLRDVNLAVQRDARIRLSGANGTGKTSLLRALLAAAGPRVERMLYLPQELPADTVVDAGTRTFDILAALGVDPGRLRASAQPSPGELRKLVLAQGLARSAWVLLLDEPTNHLDLPSIERLQIALADYPGALVLVSHDDAFADALTETTWRLEDGRVIS